MSLHADRKSLQGRTLPPSEARAPGGREAGRPRVSVIIPVHNDTVCLPRCLEAVAASTNRDFEIIVVDDCSTDSTPELAVSYGVQCISTPVNSGPAAARNLGSKVARGEILLFVDVDVLLPPEALSVVADRFESEPELAALFGSYDDQPPWNNLLSQYKNLMHHYVHQISNPEATTFWTGLGAVRKEVFQEMGGFDEQRYRRPSIEDIELGYRMRQAGYRIALEKRLQGKHLKRWNFLSLLDSDILCRAIPWSRLILETKNLPRDLNLRLSHRISSMLVGLLVLLAPLLVFTPEKLFGVSGPVVIYPSWLLLLGAVLFLNRDFYRFFVVRKGWLFAGAAVGLHCLYYFYSGVTFALCWVVFRGRTWPQSLLGAMGLHSNRRAG